MLRIRDETDWWWKDPIGRATSSGPDADPGRAMPIVEYTIDPPKIIYDDNYVFPVKEADITKIMDDVLCNDAAYKLSYTRSAYYQQGPDGRSRRTFEYKRYHVSVNEIFLLGKRGPDGFFIKNDDAVLADNPIFNIIEDKLRDKLGVEVSICRKGFRPIQNPLIPKNLWKHDCNKKGLNIGSAIFYAKDSVLQSSHIQSVAPYGENDVVYTLENGDTTLFSQSPVVCY